MNLATLVSSLVLAASTATAGLLVAPDLPSLPTAPQGGSGPDLDLGGPGFCIGTCGNGTAPADNSTADGNQTAPPPPPQEEEPQAPAYDDEASGAETCGVYIDDSRDVEGPTSLSWSWAVGSGTRNLTVDLQASGLWSPFGGGARVALRDGDGNLVAAADTAGGSGLPFDYTAISYEGSHATGLPHGVWRLTVEADGYLGSVWLRVHSAC